MIERQNIFDGSLCDTNHDASVAAFEGGYEYFIGPTASKNECRLFKLKPSSGAYYCVYTLLEYSERRTIKAKREYKEDSRKRMKQLIRAAASRAKKRGVPFDLDSDAICARMAAGRCEATGIPFDISAGELAQRLAFSPSLDQKDPGKGYTMENVQIVCLAYNMMKSNFADGDVAKLTGWLKDGIAASSDHGAA